ncbi:hypothetical protein MRX96_045122 [Rhipicephalus microplus]
MVPGAVCPYVTAQIPSGTIHLHEESSPPAGHPPSKLYVTTHPILARAWRTTWQPWPSPTSATTGPDQVLLKQQGITDFSGHNTAEPTLLTALLQFQVLTYLVPGAVCPYFTAQIPSGTTHLREESSPPAGHPPSKLYVTSHPLLARAWRTSWQPWHSPMSATTGPDRALHKQQGITDFSGHNTTKPTISQRFYNSWFVVSPAQKNSEVMTYLYWRCRATTT